jgi:hypothetical protein
MDNDQARTEFRKEVLQTAAILHAAWRKAAAGRAAGGKKRKADNAKKARPISFLQHMHYAADDPPIIDTARAAPLSRGPC